MYAKVRSPDYTLIQATGDITYTGNTLYPQFWMKVDADNNGIADDWELPLAEKFCPYLILHAADQGVRPVPVEIMDRNSDGVLGWQDVLVGVASVGGNTISYVNPDDIWLFNQQEFYSDIYPSMRPIKIGAQIYGGAPSIYILIPCFEWGSIGDTDGSHWYNTWSSVMNQHAGESSYQHGTTYAHLFTPICNGPYVIQYWFFYPFNHWANRHEGDWEHINVVIDSQNPSTATIKRVEYYFHKYVKPCYTQGSDYWTIGGTHPKVYVGGSGTIVSYSGTGSHGSYPKAKKWPDINPWPLRTDETVSGNGLHINFNSYQNIVILPNVHSVHYKNSPLNWMWFGSHWGHPYSEPSAGESLDFLAFISALISLIPGTAPYTSWLMPFAIGVEEVKDEWIDDTTFGPRGPVAQDNLWEHVYTNCGWDEYTED